MFSKVLVKFAGVVLITDESGMDVKTSADQEKVSEEECEVQESSDENTKSQTGAAAEDKGRLKLLRQVSALFLMHVLKCCFISLLFYW